MVDIPIDSQMIAFNLVVILATSQSRRTCALVLFVLRVSQRCVFSARTFVPLFVPFNDSLDHH